MSRFYRGAHTPSLRAGWTGSRPVSIVNMFFFDHVEGRRAPPRESEIRTPIPTYGHVKPGASCFREVKAQAAPAPAPVGGGGGGKTSLGGKAKAAASAIASSIASLLRFSTAMMMTHMPVFSSSIPADEPDSELSTWARLRLCSYYGIQKQQM